MKHIISTFLLAATFSLSAAAQEFRSAYFMQTSTTRHELNPALLDSTSFITMPIALGYANVGTTGNVGLKTFIFEMQPSWQGYGTGGRNRTTFMHPNVDAATFLDGLKTNNRLSVNLKYQLAAVSFKALHGQNIVELNLRSNTNVALPKSLFEFMKEAGARSDYEISDLGVRSESFIELGLGHSHKLNDRITVGAKVKFLLGLAYAYLDVNKLNLHLDGNSWAIDGDAKLTAALMKTDLEYDTNPEKMKDGRRRVDGLGDFSVGLTGFGLGFDLGMTYKVLDDLTLSASLTDLGFISWSGAETATTTGTWQFDGFTNPIYCGGTDTGNNKLDDQLDAIGDDLEEMFSLYEDGSASTKATRALAATLNVGAEYTLPAYRPLRFGFLYSSKFAGKYSYHSGMLSANIRPAKWFEATADLAFTSTGVTGGLTVDFRLKHFNVFVGTDRFFGKLSKQFIPLNRANANLALGISFLL